MPILKLHLPEGSERMEFASTATVGEFVDTIARKTGIKTERIAIICGYPPVKHAHLDSSAPLSSIAKDGEVVTIREETPGSLAVDFRPSAPSAPIEASEVPDAAASVIALFRELELPYSEDTIRRAIAICGSEDFDLLMETCAHMQKEPIAVTAASSTAVIPSPITRKVIAADNSCLFNAVIYTSRMGIRDNKELRRLIAETVTQDPNTYSEGFLGKPTAEYAAWILSGDTWGGEIELSIMAPCLSLEIAVADIQTGNVYVYGEGAGFSSRVYLLYDGIHYDALHRPSSDGGSFETVFRPGDEKTLEEVKSFSAAMRASHSFVDMSNFTLQCRSCGYRLMGRKEAVAHASATGHSQFGEYAES